MTNLPVSEYLTIKVICFPFLLPFENEETTMTESGEFPNWVNPYFLQSNEVLFILEMYPLPTNIWRRSNTLNHTMYIIAVENNPLTCFLHYISLTFNRGFTSMDNQFIYLLPLPWLLNKLLEPFIRICYLSPWQWHFRTHAGIAFTNLDIFAITCHEKADRKFSISFNR